MVVVHLLLLLHASVLLGVKVKASSFIPSIFHSSRGVCTEQTTTPVLFNCFSPNAREAISWSNHLRGHCHHHFHHRGTAFLSSRLDAHSISSPSSSDIANEKDDSTKKKKKVVIIGAGWGGLSAAHALSSSSSLYDITVIDSSPRVGGLVRDGYNTRRNQTRVAEAGQHGFWDNYYNIFHLLQHDIPGLDSSTVLTEYAEQGQYSPRGLEAVWPVYHEQPLRLPTGLAQALYTKFMNLSWLDRLSAVPLILAFCDFDDTREAWDKYDSLSFYDLCLKLGVSRKCYNEAFEPMILTGLFAPGNQCSAAAALGMAYFFVLSNQFAFDVKWCRGNIGDKIFTPWMECMEQQPRGVKFLLSTRVVGFEMEKEKAGGGKKTSVKGGAERISNVICRSTREKTANGNDVNGGSDDTEQQKLEADYVIFAVGAEALNAMVRTNTQTLGRHEEFRKFANLRGTAVLATRLYLDQTIDLPYSANACWGFDRGVGMTFFDISTIHGKDGDAVVGAPGSVVEVDYYHAASLLALTDEAIVTKVKRDLDTMLGPTCSRANVVDAAIVRLPRAVNWYFPGSYSCMPDVKSQSFENVYFAGDIVRTRHGSWSQEKAYVTGIEAANAVLSRAAHEGIIPLPKDEAHVALGRNVVSTVKHILGGGDPSRAPSLADFWW